MGNIVCSLITFILEAILIWQYADRLFTPKQSQLGRFLVLCALYIVLFFGFFFESPWINASLTLLVDFIFFATLYKIKWYTAFFHAVILLGIMSINELIVYNIIAFFSPGFFTSSFYWRNMILHTIFSKALSFIVIHILIYLLKGRRESSQPQGKSFYLLTLLPATTAFIVTILITINEAVSIPDSLQWMSWIGAIFMLAANVLVFILYWYEQKKSSEFSEMKLLLERESSSAEYYEMLLSQNENQRILIHDMKKHLQSISFLNQKQEQKEIDEYIRRLIDSYDLQQSSRLCDNEMLDMILHRYSQLCKDESIAFHADVRSGSTQFITNSDLTSLFCNLLDNALEASAGLPKAFIEMQMEARANTPFVTLTVRNSCLENPFSSDNQLITHKSNKQRHGLGIKSIQKVVKQYGGEMGMYYDEKEQTFHTNILLRQLKEHRTNRRK